MPWTEFTSERAAPLQSCPLPGLAVPALGPHEDDESERQTEAEPQTMSVHRKQHMYIVGRLSVVTSGQSVGLTLEGAGRGLLLVPDRTTWLLSTP